MKLARTFISSLFFMILIIVSCTGRANVSNSPVGQSMGLDSIIELVKNDLSADSVKMKTDSIFMMEKQTIGRYFLDDGTFNPWAGNTPVQIFGEFIYRLRSDSNLLGHLDTAIQNTVSGFCQRLDEIQAGREPVFIAWDKLSHNYNGKTMEYYIANTNTANQEKAVLVLFLHGKLSNGIDAFYMEHGHKCIHNYLLQNGMKSIVLLPKCSNSNGDWSRDLTMLRALIEQFSDSIDHSRIYIAGSSNGGNGVWQMIGTYPDLFAGAMPVAFGEQWVRPTSIPVCMAFEKKKKPNTAGIETVKIDRRPSNNHGDCCQKSFNNDNMGWLFSQHK